MIGFRKTIMRYLALGVSVLLLNLVSGMGSVAAKDLPASPDSSVNKLDVVASYSDEAITREDVVAVLKSATSEQKRNLGESDSAADSLVKEMLLRRVLAAQARKEGFERDPATAARIVLAGERTLSDLYFEKVELAAIDEKKVERIAREEYLAHPERFRKEELRARHILVREVASRGDDARTIAEALLARVKAGEAFDELAHKYSDDPGSAAKGGDLGWLPKGKTVKEFEEALFALKKPGDVSGIISTQFGYHIIRLEEAKPVVTLPYEEVKAQLIERVKADLRRKARGAIVDPIIKSDAFSVNRDALTQAVGAAGVK